MTTEFPFPTAAMMLERTYQAQTKAEAEAEQGRVLFYLIAADIEAAASMGKFEVTLDISQYEPDIVNSIAVLLSRSGYNVIRNGPAIPLGRGGSLMIIRWKSNWS